MAAVFILLSGLAYLFGSQFTSLYDSLPQFKLKFRLLAAELMKWISDNFHINELKINSFMLKAGNEIVNNSTAVMGKTVGAVSGLLIALFLMPVYIFLILLYKSLLLGFISQLLGKERHQAGEGVLSESKSLIQNYLTGLLIEILIVVVLNTAALLIIGIKYAVMLGVIAALLNIIPYLGAIIAMGITMGIAIATKSVSSALWVFVAYTVIKLIDNNFIIPKIVAFSVKLNALVSIIAVLAGGALWGVAGMFLSIPLISILKVIFDRTEYLRPLGFLLGNNQPSTEKTIFNIKRSGGK
jgi:predicted PurR-regulated permease PerM